jgi:Ca2+-binding RTX toxin-like protein
VIVSGGPGEDRLFGGGGNDALEGNGGDDVLRGQAARDQEYAGLSGGGGDDRYGGKGGDELEGGTGRDVLRFGPGRDGGDEGRLATILTGAGQATIKSAPARLRGRPCGRASAAVRAVTPSSSGASARLDKPR